MKKPNEVVGARRPKKSFVSGIRNAVLSLRRKCSSPLHVAVTKYFSDSDSDGGEGSDGASVASSITTYKEDDSSLSNSCLTIDVPIGRPDDDLDYEFISMPVQEEGMNLREHWIVIQEEDCF
mmetsp:Transcript_13124/g.21483  ORF Transcript_13124/g.21483 Transcript_13124/m.21483 type:complete len:122 (+) Transcript_13124:144-509(+)|eukprot:CAMPEP_0114417448 /NCGR_PEP_ID=MMETSP0103-20121206/2969_1 /TAXON_ID=37642 ORGANISM="Paraphysomonas imperforata, Strain PA2" /NCGR_SAMPLE_ID=MMETSP0103 /ASSEMBLY_ACC=CAM_ASM_000201 /LENGTH=121 /DNA_ID=CAMNT_0001585741 /DNA_START=127 /DNA_END=492 /DNA_ORIENTATION=+